MGKHCNTKNCQSKKEGCISIPIKQCHLDKHEGIYVIDKPGNYHLTKDIKGTISIQSSSVCLNLCCHTIDANGLDNAIIIGQLSENRSVFVSNDLDEEACPTPVKSKRITRQFKNVSKREVLSKSADANSLYHIRVSNGSIIGANVNAISINNCFDVNLENITFIKNSNTSIYVNSSSGITMENVTFNGSLGGQSGIIVENSDKITIEKFVMTQYISENDSILRFTNSNTISLKNGEISNNTKTRTTTSGSGASRSILRFVSSSEIQMKNVKVNNNLFQSELLNISFTGIIFLFCQNVKLYSCEACENKDERLDPGNGFPTIFLADTSNNFLIKDFQGNNNICQNVSSFFIFRILDSNNMIFDNCQGNFNSVELLVPSTTFFGEFFVFKATYRAGTESNCDNNIYRNCQANFNTVTSGGDRSQTEVYGFLIGFQVEKSCRIENCQANWNIMYDNPEYTFVSGITCVSAQNLLILGCNTENNRGGSFSQGILFGPLNIDCYNVTVKDCIINSNGTYGLVLGFPEDLPFTNVFKNIVIQNCVINKNQEKGIYTFPHIGVNNLLIKECQIYDTSKPDQLLFSTSGPGPSKEEPYIADTIPITMNGAESIIVSFKKDSIFYEGVDSCYFFVRNLNITNPVTNVPVPLSGAPLGDISNETFFDSGSLRFTAISANITGLWKVEDLANTVPVSKYSGDLVGERVIRAGFQEIYSPSSPGNSVPPFNTENYIFKISSIDGDANRVYTFDLNIRNSSETDFDFLTVSKMLDNTDAQGISVENAKTVVIENTNVFNSSNGIFLKDVTDSKIIKSEVHSNVLKGIQIIGGSSKVSLIENIASNNGKGFVLDELVTKSLVQDNRAVGNTISGFEQIASQGFSTVYIGNESQNDFNNYDISLTSKINLQELSLSNGDYTNINGNAPLATKLTNISVVP